MTLSKNRVEAAKKYLIVKGVSGARIKTTKALAERKPISTANTPEAHRMNRRVAIACAFNYSDKVFEFSFG